MLKRNKIILALLIVSVVSIIGMLFIPHTQAEDGHEGHDHATPAKAESGHEGDGQSPRVSVTQDQVTRLGI